MDTASLSVITILMYAAASMAQGLSSFTRAQKSRAWMIVLGFLSVGVHALLLHRWIDLVAGQNLNFFNMLSLVMWLISLFALLIILFKPADMLVIFIFPLAIVSILLVIGFPSRFVINTNAQASELFHILFSVITFAVMCIAGFQAILLAIQERVLRFKIPGTLFHKLPPLILMEKLLFQMISIGFISLTLLLATSFYSFHAIMLSEGVILQKTIVVIAAWVVIGLLLLGRYLWGWRGRKAIYCTLFGVLLLLVVYFGSKLIFIRS